MVDEARTAGYKIISIPSNLKNKIQGQTDMTGKPIRDLSQFSFEYTQSFEFKFIDPKDLKPNEKHIFDMTNRIFDLIGGKPKEILEIKVSETMRKEIGSFVEAEGVWEADRGRIIVKRSTLRSIEIYAGTLLHETAHALSGASDVSREFEGELTEIVGDVSAKSLD